MPPHDAPPRAESRLGILGVVEARVEPGEPLQRHAQPRAVAQQEQAARAPEAEAAHAERVLRVLAQPQRRPPGSEQRPAPEPTDRREHLRSSRRRLQDESDSMVGKKLMI